MTVFVSYSRRDAEFTRRLCDAFIERGINPWVDWEDIAKGADWQAEIQEGIEGSDSFLFVISPDSLASEICNQELAHAIRQNKRVIPLLHREIDEADIPEIAHNHWQVIRHINWVFFRSSDDFPGAFNTLLDTLNTDLGYVKQHTRLTIRALEWEKQGRKSDFLLRGDELESAAEWLASSGGKSPKPTELVTQYIWASQHASSRRQRQLLAGVSIALGITLLLAVTAFILYRQAEQARADAEKNAAQARSLALSTSAQQAYANDNLDLALVLALEAVKTDPDSPQAQLSLSEAAYAPGTRYLLEGHTGPVLDVAASTDWIVSAGADGNVMVWQDGHAVRTIKAGAVPILRLALTSQTVITGDTEGNLREWDITTGDSLCKFEKTHSGSILSIVPIENGLLTSGQDRKILWWENCQLRREFAHLDSEVYSLDFDDSRILSGSKAVQMWDISSGELIRTFEGFTGVVYDVAFSPDGHTAAAASSDTHIYLWDTETGELLQRNTPHTNRVTTIQFSPDGDLLLSASADNTVCVWSVDGQETRCFDGHKDNANAAVFGPDGANIISASDDATIRVWDLTNGAEAAHYVAGSTVLSLAVSENRIFAGTNSQQVIRYEGDAPPTSFDGHAGWVTALAVHGDLAVSGDTRSRLIFWDTRTGRILRVSSAHEGEITTVVISQDGQWAVSGSRDKTLILWDLTDFSEERRFVGHTDWVWDADLSHDGTKLVSASSDDRVILWDVATGTILRQFEAHRRGVLSVAWNHDDTLIVSGGADHAAIIWDAATGKILAWLEHPDWVWSAVFSPDGKEVLTGAGDGLVRLWNLAAQQEVQRYAGHTGPIRQVAFFPDGKRAATASEDGSVRLWQFPDSLKAQLTWAAENRYVWQIPCEERPRYPVLLSCDTTE